MSPRIGDWILPQSPDVLQGHHPFSAPGPGPAEAAPPHPRDCPCTCIGANFQKGSPNPRTEPSPRYQPPCQSSALSLTEGLNCASISLCALHPTSAVMFLEVGRVPRGTQHRPAQSLAQANPIWPHAPSPKPLTAPRDNSLTQPWVEPLTQHRKHQGDSGPPRGAAGYTCRQPALPCPTPSPHPSSSSPLRPCSFLFENRLF